MIIVALELSFGLNEACKIHLCVEKAVELKARLGHGICQHESDPKSMVRHHHRWAAADTGQKVT